MIYDRNQFTFNLIYLCIFLVIIVAAVYFNNNLTKLNYNYDLINEKLSEIENNQNGNFVQASHMSLDYELMLHGIMVISADDFGKLTGPSMQPAIFDGNTVLEQKYTDQILKEGMIVRFIRDDGQAVIHRIRADYGDSIFVQGDTLNEGEVIPKARVTHIIIGVLFT